MTADTCRTRPASEPDAALEHDRFLESGVVSRRIRPVVADSWRRSAAAGVDVEHGEAPRAFERDELADYRDAHPLSPVFPLLYDVLGRAAYECDSLMAVGDSEGRLLWVCGQPSVVAQAERINFVEGTSWDEGSAGTNAPGTALRLDAPVQIRAAEHFRRAVQPWSCAAAPIHDPLTQTVLGVVDVTGGDEIARPQTLAMVRAAARMAEAELGRILAVSGRGAAIATGDRRYRVQALGRFDCLVELGDKTLRLSQRHSEILVLLADQPDGLSGDQLALELYNGDITTSTTRAELTRLRALLGEQYLRSRPYRLRTPPAADWLAVRGLLDQGRVAEALRVYHGPLLPQSDAPGVVRRRVQLERDLRRAVFAADQLDLMVAWTRSRWGADDIEMWQRQAGLLPTGSPLLPLVRAEVRRLNRELG